MSAAQICNSFRGKSISHKSFPTLEKDNFRIFSSGDMTLPSGAQIILGRLARGEVGRGGGSL